jgi:chromodomain-helicase-DNA-binding protein 7
MQLRKCCNHPMMIREMYNELAGKSSDHDYLKVLIETSGKMILLDKMVEKFLAENKKILIFS